MSLETIFALGPIVGIFFLFHCALLACFVANSAWNIIHMVWFRWAVGRFNINNNTRLYRVTDKVDDFVEWLTWKPIDLYSMVLVWCWQSLHDNVLMMSEILVFVLKWGWDRLTGKSRRELVKRVAHLEAQLDPVSEHRAFDRGVFLKREGALICRAEKAERLLAATEKLLDGYPEVRCNDLVSQS